MNSVGRNKSIDLIKIVAMMMVLLFHNGVARYHSCYQYLQYNDIYYIAGIAIPLFFMVSGYLMSGKNCDYRYCVAKILRILRFCMIVCMVYDVTRSVIHGEIRSSLPGCFIQEGPFFVFWYFGAMMIIYCLLPLIMRIIQSRQSLLFAFCVSLSISTVVFVLNSMSLFEKEYICQTFRIWYWTMYFLLGVIVHRNQEWLSEHIPAWAIPVMCILFVLEGRLIKAGGNEYHFGSLLCVLYALSVFVGILKLDMRESKVVESLSRVFLPVYAFHMIVLKILYNTGFMYLFEIKSAVLSVTIEYVISSILVIAGCVVIMKIPYMDKVFRI